MIKLKALDAYLCHLLKSDTIKDYCCNGIQLEGKLDINFIATAVTASLATIEAAAALEVDALIVHHGLFWDKEPHYIRGAKKEKLEILLKKGISVLAYHLPLDCHQELGNNWLAAKHLGWNDLQPFGMGGGLSLSVALGVKGRFPPVSVEKFKQQLEAYYEHPAHAALGGKGGSKGMVSSGAIISGGAYEFTPEAAAAGVDCFVTGNFDEPAWHMAHEEKIHFFAMGHSATERVGPKALAAHIAQKFSMRAEFIDIANPF